MADFPTAVPSDGSLLIARDNVASTLNGGLSAVAVSATLASTALFPAKGVATIESEIIFFGANNTATSVLSSITRSFLSTTAAIHADGTTVNMYNTSGHHNLTKDEVIAIAQNIKDRFGLATTPGQILGTATNDSATAGNVGENLFKISAGAVSLTTAQYSDGGNTGLTLTTGDFDVWSVGRFTCGASTTVESLAVTIGTVSGNDGTGSDADRNVTQYQFGSPGIVPTGNREFVFSSPPFRVSLASPTVYFPKVRTVFTVSTITATANIFSRRAR